MHIKLIYPRMSLRPMDSEYKRALSPSLSLLMLAAVTPPGHAITIADENLGPVPTDDFPDLVGFTVNVDTSTRAYRMAARYRRRGIPVVMGGIHVSANPEEALQHADAVCIGEGEPVWPRLLADTAAGSLQRRYSASQAMEPGDIPRPAWHLIDSTGYLYTNIVIASRGCPFACDFCYNSCDFVHHRFRPRPVEQVMDEIGQLGTRQVLFVDDNLLGRPAWTRELLEAMRDRHLTWHAAVSADLVDHPDLLDRMAATGCRSLFIGFESVNGESLAGAGKRQNRRPTFERLIGEIHRRGIMVNASMVFGFDHDRPDVFARTLAWLTDNKVETMTAHLLTPYPGTRAFRQLESEGRIIDRDWSHYNTARVVFRPRHLAPTELQSGYLRIYREFYSFRNILRRLPDDPRRVAPFLLFNLWYRRGGRITSRLGRWGLMNTVGKALRRLSYGIE